MRHLTIALPLASTATASAGPAEVTQIFNDPTPVSKALAEGDVVTLRQLQANASNEVVQKMAGAAERRVLLDLPGTRKASDECIQVAQQAKHLAGLTVCGALRAGAEAAAVDLPAWARLTVEAQERVRAAAGTRGKVLGTIDVFARVPDYPELAARPVPTVREKANGHIALHASTVQVAAGESHDGGSVSYPNMANVEIEGKVAEVLVDTGSALTIVRPSAITAPTLMEGFLLSGALGTSNERSALAQPQTLKLGTLAISKPLISVSDKIPASLLGLDVLSRLERVIITQDELQPVASTSTAPACNSPLFSAADLSGTQTVPRLFITVNGRRQEAMLDTGNSSELVESLPLGSPLPPGPVLQSVVQGVQGQQRRLSVQREVTVQTSSGPVKLQMTTSVGNHPTKTRYTLGAGSLRTLNIYLDFVDNKACLLSSK